jgi:hypothetical protein
MVAGLGFLLRVVVGLERSRARARATFGLELPGGVGWIDRPGASDQCSSTATTVECKTSLDDAVSGQFDSWAWRVAATRPGSYTFVGRITEMSAPDARPADNETRLTVVVSEGVTVSAVKLTPARPKAGGPVIAAVRVTSAGEPIRPSSVACAGTSGGASVRGTRRVSTGAAACTFRPPRSAKGKVFRGSVTIAAGGARFTKRFSAKLA